MFSHDGLEVTYFWQEGHWSDAAPFSVHCLGDMQCQCLIPENTDFDHVVKVVPPVSSQLVKLLFFPL